MIRAQPLDEPSSGASVALPGLAADNLLAFMALLGLLRALDHQRPDWQARVRWGGQPWTAELLLAAEATEAEIAAAAETGVSAIAACYRLGPVGSNHDVPRDVKFTGDEYREIVAATRSDPIAAALVSTLAAEMPVRRDGTVRPGPLVLQFGQGHQHFIARLMAIPRLAAPPPVGRKSSASASGADKIAEALYAPWTRTDKTDAFRWDPAEDQRYAMRFEAPTKSGAPPTMHGANRLAALGLLSFPCAAGERSLLSAGSTQEGRQRCFFWPIWTEPLTLFGIETLLTLDIPGMDQAERLHYGVASVIRALCVENARSLNVTLGSEI